MSVFMQDSNPVSCGMLSCVQLQLLVNVVQGHV